VWQSLTTGLSLILKSLAGPLKNDKAPTKTNTTYDVESHDELSEGRLSSDDEDVIEKFNAKIEKFEAEKDTPVSNYETKHSEDLDSDSEDEKNKMKEVLSKEAQSMLTDLAKDSSGMTCLKHSQPSPVSCFM
jgi:hypothetical protein